LISLPNRKDHADEMAPKIMIPCQESGLKKLNFSNISRRNPTTAGITRYAAIVSDRCLQSSGYIFSFAVLKK
jgi:hypothetical protein